MKRTQRGSSKGVTLGTIKICIRIKTSSTSSNDPNIDKKYSMANINKR